MGKKSVRAKETRYEYAGSDLDKWFDEVPLKFPGRDAIWSLATADDGKLYIGLAGEHNRGTAALAAYDPKKGGARIVCDLGELLGDPRTIGRAPHSKIHFAICPVKRHIWFATHVSGAMGRDDIYGPIGRGPTADTMTGYEGGRLLRYDTKTGQTEQFGVIVPAEGARCLHVSPDARYGYGISYPKHRFFMRDLKTGETYISGRIGRYGGIDLFVDRRGRPWGAHDGYEGTEPGQFYYFDQASRRLVDVEAYLPRSSRRRMSFPRFGSHVLHMTETPDGQAMVSSYGESRIALFDPKSLTVYDWGPVWDKPPVQKLIPRSEVDRWHEQHKHERRRRRHRHHHDHGPRPHFAWCPVFDTAGRTIDGKRYDRLVWYGEECWEYQEDVRLCAIAYNHNRPGEIVKIRFGTPTAGGYRAGHWAASARGLDGRIYFTDRVRDPHNTDGHRYKALRLAVLTPPEDLGPLRKV